jgi:hypothetical protein
MKRKYLPLVLMLLTEITYSQSTVTLTADRDNTIYSESGTVSNGAGQHLFAGVTAQSTIRRALLHFDLSSIPAGAVINSATLTLHVNKQAASSQGVTLSRVDHDWGEGTSDAEQNEGAGTAASAGDVTWANSLYPASSWANPGGDFGTITVTIPTASPGINNITGEAIKADVESFINNPSINFGWIIKSSNETGSANALRFSSRENANTGQRPTLTINYSVSLPVELKEFKVEAQGRAAVLNWQTVTEVSNSHFEVEHSSDGIHFKKHPLYLLANKINWTVFEDNFKKHYSEKMGKPAKPIRLMVSLLILKHVRNQSDENLVEQWSENLYFQYFSGEQHFHLLR